MRFLVLLLSALVTPPPPAQTVAGAAQIVDGDTLVIEDTTVRLIGIDAPELDQTCTLDGAQWQCGKEAKQQLLSVVDGQSVTCVGDALDPDGRLLSRCNANGFELGATMVEYGWAVAYRKYSDDYVAQELRAKSSRLGLWRSDFVRPEYHRRAQVEEQGPVQLRESSETTRTREQTGCTIKGNRSRRGEWIYHLPGMRYYQQTRAEEIFCSEAKARAAGYRRSKV